MTLRSVTWPVTLLTAWMLVATFFFSCYAEYWIGLCSVLRPLQHSIGYMGDGFYRSKDPTNSIKVLKEKAAKENNPKNTKKTENTHTQNSIQLTVTQINTASPLVYTNMGWLGDSSHRGQVCWAWTAVGLPPQYTPCYAEYMTLNELSYQIIIEVLMDFHLWSWIHTTLSGHCHVHIKLFSRIISYCSSRPTIYRSLRQKSLEGC